MTYTSHGHHIAGTTKDDEFGQIARTRCGGQLLCTVCMKDAESVIKALEKGIDVTGLFDAPEVSKDDPALTVIDRAKLFIVGSRNNTVEDEKDQITVEDLVVTSYTLHEDGWTVHAWAGNPYLKNLYFIVTYSISDKETTTVTTYLQIEQDLFSQES